MSDLLPSITDCEYDKLDFSKRSIRCHYGVHSGPDLQSQCAGTDCANSPVWLWEQRRSLSDCSVPAGLTSPPPVKSIKCMNKLS